MSRARAPEAGRRAAWAGAARPASIFKAKMAALPARSAPEATLFIAFRRLAGGLALAALGGCASWQDAPRLAYQCPHELRFEARLYQDMALLEGLRGHAVLERVPGAEGDALHYADPTVRARFGLGLDARLVRLDYTGIPEPVYCQHLPGADAPAAAVRASPRPGPRPPPPRPDPDAPVQTNIRQGDGRNGPG